MRSFDSESVHFISFFHFFFCVPEGTVRWSVRAGALRPAVRHCVARGDGEVSAAGENLRELAAVEGRRRPCEASS